MLHSSFARRALSVRFSWWLRKFADQLELFTAPFERDRRTDDSPKLRILQSVTNSASLLRMCKMVIPLGGFGGYVTLIMAIVLFLTNTIKFVSATFDETLYSYPLRSGARASPRSLRGR